VLKRESPSGNAAQFSGPDDVMATGHEYAATLAARDVAAGLASARIVHAAKNFIAGSVRSLT
jgi:hypothetical protein